MKTTVKLYRITTVRTADLVVAAGLNASDLPTVGKLESKIREEFYPLANRFKIFYPSDVSIVKTVVGMECMAFDIREASTPQAGMVLTDPMLPQDVDRIDGALESELNRMGIGTDFEGYEWRMAYELKGN